MSHNKMIEGVRKMYVGLHFELLCKFVSLSNRTLVDKVYGNYFANMFCKKQTHFCQRVVL